MTTRKVTYSQQSLVKPPIHIRKSVAIVLSSPRLLEEERGAEIDAHRDVFRFNRAITEGFEKYCGSKETLRVMNSHVAACCSIHEPADQNFACDIRGRRVLVVASHHRWKGAKKKIHESNKLHYLNSKTWLNKQTLFDYDCRQQASLGLMLTLIVVRRRIVPDVYGFDITGEVTGHYWGDGYDSTASAFHNFATERACFQRLLDAGKIKLFASGL